MILILRKCMKYLLSAHCDFSNSWFLKLTLKNYHCKPTPKPIDMCIFIDAYCMLTCIYTVFWLYGCGSAVAEALWQHLMHGKSSSDKSLSIDFCVRANSQSSLPKLHDEKCVETTVWTWLHKNPVVPKSDYNIFVCHGHRVRWSSHNGINSRLVLVGRLATLQVWPWSIIIQYPAQVQKGACLLMSQSSLSSYRSTSWNASLTMSH